jgi:hypothetical protein
MAAAAPMAVERIFRWMDIIVVMVVVEVEVESGSCVIIMMYSYDGDKWWILILDFGFRIADFGFWIFLDLDLDTILSDRFNIGTVQMSLIEVCITYVYALRQYQYLHASKSQPLDSQVLNSRRRGWMQISINNNCFR